MSTLPIIGQECVCPEGLGRVVGFGTKDDADWIQVKTYVNSKNARWLVEHVRLIALVYEDAQDAPENTFRKLKF